MGVSTEFCNEMLKGLVEQKSVHQLHNKIEALIVNGPACDSHKEHVCVN